MNSPHQVLFQAIVLAAGRGSRMGSDLPKVLLPLCGRPMLTYVLAALAEAGIARPIVVVGSGGDAVWEALGDAYTYALQNEPLGSGHAVLCAREAAIGAEHILVMCGDSPLFRAQTINALMDAHVREQAVITLTSAVLEDPQGYGRILRTPNGDVAGIVEEELAVPERKAIKEVNGGCCAFDAGWLWENIGAMRRNEAGEYYLTEMVDTAVSQRRKVIAVPAAPDEVLGVNTRAQLEQAEEILRRRGF